MVQNPRMFVAGLGVRRITNRCSGPHHHKVPIARTALKAGRQTSARIAQRAAAELSR